MIELEYPGAELELFAEAENWKRYFATRLREHIRGRVLEVGSGIGATTDVLWRQEATRWTCLEPDPDMAERLRERCREGSLPDNCAVRLGTTAELTDCEGAFDTVLYIDVLEHIEDDREELARAASLLAPGGRLIVLSPAHNWLFTPFDQSIGHFRRYNRAALRQLTPPGLDVVRLFYLDSVGLCASLGNRVLLKQSMPTARQIWIWDRLMVRASRCADVLFGYRLGKTVLGVWRKPDDAAASCGADVER